jgi:bacterioferritin-associated ferredoxin
MTAVFIFADQIREALAAGKKEIEVPEGARISAAAHDLIRDHKLRLTHVREPQAAAEGSLPDDPDPVDNAADGVTAEIQPDPESGGTDSPPDGDTEIPDAVLEEIVDRVIAKFKQIKSSEPETAATDVATAAVATVAGQTNEDDMVICRCEEITKGEIKDAIRNGMRTLNGIKRVTRAGMGLCQGQTCQRLVAQIVSEELGLSAAEIDPTTARGPVRPLRLEVFANR